MPSPELLSFFRERVTATYALEARFKQDLLHQLDTFDADQIEKILRTIAEYEQKIAKDARKESEEKHDKEDKKIVNNSFHFF
jgi:cell division septum initiation protein DivIVA